MLSPAHCFCCSALPKHRKETRLISNLPPKRKKHFILTPSTKYFILESRSRLSYNSSHTNSASCCWQLKVGNKSITDSQGLATALLENRCICSRPSDMIKCRLPRCCGEKAEGHFFIASRPINQMTSERIISSNSKGLHTKKKQKTGIMADINKDNLCWSANCRTSNTQL